MNLTSAESVLPLSTLLNLDWTEIQVCQVSGRRSLWNSCASLG